MLNVKEFCQAIPKVELHAHLNGSISQNIFLTLGIPKIYFESYQLKDQFAPKSNKLSECFTLFKLGHAITSNTCSVYAVTQHVIEEFSNEKVMYLELRTTPRNEDGMSKIQYLEAVVQAIKDDKNDILVKLIPSIDRAHSLENSEESLSAILEMHSRYPDIIKGIDLSGDPNKGSFDQALFQKARDKGLKVTLHCAEIKNDNEVMQMLKFKPDRIGHAAYIHPNYGGSNELWKTYCDLKIPTEFCLTSNVSCGTTKDYKYHHSQEWKTNNLPFMFNTDDKGIFNTTLWEEYYHASQHLGFSDIDIHQCCWRAIHSSFATAEEKCQMGLKLARGKF